MFNVFAIESFIDQMAVDANMDPIAVPLRAHGRDAQGAQVLRDGGADVRLEGAASGRAARSACRSRERSGSLGAGVVEISLDRQTGKIKVHKVWVAVDGGIIVTPGPAKANVESAIIYGLSSVLHERVTLKDGVVEQTNFHDYNLMRMSDLPDEMHVQFVDVDTRPTGPGRDRQPVHRGRDLERVPPADRQAAAPPAVHAGARAGDAEGVRLRSIGTGKRPPVPAGVRFGARMARAGRPEKEQQPKKQKNPDNRQEDQFDRAPGSRSTCWRGIG